jgi:hypothetical protein
VRQGAADAWSVRAAELRARNDASYFFLIVTVVVPTPERVSWSTAST